MSLHDTPIHTNDMTNIELYHTDLAVKKSLADQSERNINWPPTSETINQDECMKLVPVELFNLLALVTGATDEVSPSDIFVEVTDEAKVNIRLCHQTCVLAPLQSRQNELLLIKGKISDLYS